MLTEQDIFETALEGSLNHRALTIVIGEAKINQTSDHVISEMSAFDVFFCLTFPFKVHDLPLFHMVMCSISVV